MTTKEDKQGRTEAPMQFGSYPSLRNRVVVVTGGASGIGETIVEQFAKQGAGWPFWTSRTKQGRNL